jgi:hypothetical protein
MSRALLLMTAEEVAEHKRQRTEDFEEEQKQRRAAFDATEAAIEDGKTPVIQAFGVSVTNLSLYLVKRGELASKEVQQVSIAFGREASGYPEFVANIEGRGFKLFFPNTMAVDIAGWNMDAEDHETWMDKNDELEAAVWNDAKKLYDKAKEYSAELVTKVLLDLVTEASCVNFVLGLETPDMRLLTATASAIQHFDRLVKAHKSDRFGGSD